MTAWTYLALRDERLIGAGERPDDARRLCEDKMAQMHETMPQTNWWPAFEPPEPDPRRGELIQVRWLYAIRRVPVARFGGEGSE